MLLVSLFPYEKTSKVENTQNMIKKSELQELLQSTETYRVERTSSTSVPQDVPQDVPQGVPQGVPQDNELDDWIEKQIRNNPQISTEDLAKLSNRSSKTIKRHLAKMPHIRYVGSGYSGHWEIVE